MEKMLHCGHTFQFVQFVRRRTQIKLRKIFTFLYIDYFVEFPSRCSLLKATTINIDGPFKRQR